MFKDDGHYYLNEMLIEGMTKAQCRDQGGIPSVTTKIGSWNDNGIIFWKINENIEAAYAVLDRANDITLEDFKKIVADEFYRTHNYIRLGTRIHDVLGKAINQGIPNNGFVAFYKAHAHESVADLFESVQIAYEWYLETVSQCHAEVVLYDKEAGISGTCDIDGVITTPDGAIIPGGVDWKCSFIKRHPGFRKTDGRQKSFGKSKDIKHKMQLGPYGRVRGWRGAYLVYISTNPLVPGIQVQYYDEADLHEGFRAYAYIARAYDVINGF